MTEEKKALSFAPPPDRLCKFCGRATVCGGCKTMPAPQAPESASVEVDDAGGDAAVGSPPAEAAYMAPEQPSTGQLAATSTVVDDAGGDAAAGSPPAEAEQVTAASTVVDQLDAEQQRQLVAQVAEIWRHAPPVRPHTPGGQALRVTVSAAGELCWWSDAKGYRYISRHPGGYAWPTIPEAWLALWRRYSGRPDLKPDCALINWYDAGAALGWHSDVTEQDPTLPVVTISLGDPAQWAVRGREGAPVSRCRLESGAVVLLAGPTRALEHTIERLLPAVEQVGLGFDPPPFVPMESPLPKRGRISITLRVAGSPKAAASAAYVPPPPAPPTVPYEQARAFLEELQQRTGRRTG